MYKFFVSFCYEELENLKRPVFAERSHDGVVRFQSTPENLKRQLISNTEIEIDFLIKAFDEIKIVEKIIEEKLDLKACKIIFYKLLSETF